MRLTAAPGIGARARLLAASRTMMTRDAATADQTASSGGTGACDRVERYHPAEIELRCKRGYYLLTMYPYPSGDIHIGHWYIKTPTDAIARFQRMHGKNVFLPIGFDAFGLPAENAAIKNSINPRDWTMRTSPTCGASSAGWAPRSTGTREVVTSDPEYYRWNQWLFLQFLEAGLAYRAKSAVDWCPNDGTLAREQVEGADRRCWRCGAKVEKRDLDQWYLRSRSTPTSCSDFSGIELPEPIRIHADELDRPVRGRRDRLRDRAVRPPRRRRGDAGLHDPARHAVRGDVHGPRAGAPAGRER